MLELKVLNCDEKIIERKFKSVEEFVKVMNSENSKDEPLMLDDEIIELNMDGKEIKVYYLVNDLYNAYAD